MDRELLNSIADKDVLDFISDHVHLDDHHNTAILSTSTQFNVEILHHDHSASNLFKSIINLKRINDIRRINKFFEAVNCKLEYKGNFVGCVETLGERERRIINKFPRIISLPYYFLDFIFKRVFPKWSVTKKLYFFITNGRNRALSKAETLGRLVSCGFEIIKFTEINNLLYFVVRKIREPHYDNNPSYSVLYKMKRVGKNGKIIHVYKLRTMHPYSEYLQKYIYENHGTADGDKADHDFRLTAWGKLFRKLWIDELPMIINLMKRDVKIVGVRPLSLHKFSMYPEEAQEKRCLYKPGLIPPFYADLPHGLDGLIASEMNYLNEHGKHPLRTDIKYFFKAFYNIIFKGARSR